METHRADAVLSVPAASTRSAAGPEPIRVLFVMIRMAIGGSERLVLNLAASLDRRRFAPSIAWFMHEQPLSEFVDLGIPLYHVPKHKRFDWAAMRRLAAIVREQRIDVVNAHHFMSAVYAFPATRLANSAGLVYTEHSEEDVLSAAGKWKTLGRHLLNSCDSVVGVSGRVSDRLGSHFGVASDKIQTIENGVDVALFERAADRRAAVRQALGFSAEDVLIGQVANFRKNKNHLFLLKAFHQLVSNRSNVKLVLVGQGFPNDTDDSEPEIRAYVRENGLERCVNLLGYRPDVHDLLKAMDACCLVSHKEGLPLSLIEAMAAGLPLVGTNIDGIRALVQPEVNGVLADPDDVPALVRALSRLADDEALRHRMGSASLKMATERFSLARCVDQTQELFASAAADRVRGSRASARARGDVHSFGVDRSQA